MRSAWERFWYAPAPTTALGVFRVLFGVALAIELTTSLEKQRFAIAGGFHLPYTVALPLVSEPVYRLLHWLQIPFIATFTLGVAVRVSAVVLVGLQGYLFFADQLNFRNHPYVFLVLLALFACTPASDAFSLVRVLRERRLTALLGRDAPRIVARLIPFQVTVIYVYAALHKIHPAYFRGETLSYFFGLSFPTTPFWRWLSSFLSTETMASLQTAIGEPRNLAPVAIGTVALELLLPLGLWIPRTRRVAVVLGVGFHLGISVTMHILTFSLVMMASYVLFADPEAVHAWIGARLGRRRA